MYVCMYIFIYIYIFIDTYININIGIITQREIHTYIYIVDLFLHPYLVA